MPTSSHLSLASLSCRVVDRRQGGALLSAREQHRLTAVPQHRQQRWIAGRLAAKYLFLARRRDHRFTPAAVQRLDLDRLARFEPRQYRNLDVLPNAESNQPQLYLSERPTDLQLSLAHCGDLSFACLAAGARLGLDAENAVPRVRAFYRQNFAPEERSWVERAAKAAQLPRVWLYSLFWTLKESALKARLWGRGISLWDFPRLALRPVIDLDVLATSFRCKRLGDSVIGFETLLSHAPSPGDAIPGGARRVNTALTATDQQVLTVLHV